MKIVKLKGGLGNQMFQYSFALLLQSISSDEVKIDLSYFKGTRDDDVRIPRIQKFSLSLEDASSEDIAQICHFSHNGNPLSLKYKAVNYLEWKLNPKYYFETNRAYVDPEGIKKYVYFDGYWQSYKYVDKIKEMLSSDFIPNYNISKKTLEFINKISNEESVFIGVRKGDYDSRPTHYGSFSSTYYNRAISYISERIDNPVFYIYSNDVSWCKENIDWKGHNVTYREKEDQVDDFEELMTMKSCKHAIIVNSTFNWWGAYMISNPNKIVCCPQKWFFDGKPIDIIPDNWIRIYNDEK